MQHPHLGSTMRRSRILTNTILTLPGAILLALLLVTPIVVLLQMSVSNVTIENIIGSWKFVGLDNYATVIGSIDFPSTLRNTLIFVLIVLVATMGLGVVSALLLLSPRGYSAVTQTILILVWTLPPVIVGSLWRFLLASDGFVNTILRSWNLTTTGIPFLSQPSTALVSIAVVSVWVGAPFAGLVLKSAMLDVPDEILDAAKVDGASGQQVFLRIVLPVIRPTVLILAVLIVVAAFRGFDLIYTMTRGGPGTSSSTLPYLGYSTAFQDYKFGDAAAIGVFSMIIVLVLAISYIFAVRKETR